MLIAEGIPNAQKITGKKAVTGEDVRRGLETINIDAARLKELGLEGFGRPIAALLRRPQRPPPGLHAGMGRREMGEDHPTRSSRMTDRVQAELEAAAKDYAEKNAGWPKRTEACDKAS